MVLTEKFIKPRPFEPTGWVANLLLFGLPALGMVAAYYMIPPALVPFMPLSEARMLAGSLVMVGLLIAALIGFLSEGHPRTFAAFVERFRLTPMKKSGWFWALGGLVMYVVLAVIANISVPLIYRAIGFTPPIETAEPWGLSALPLVLITLVFNILGEEIWWRGYILPRQELQFGQNAWIWHGILWAFFHAFKWWTIPPLLFVCLVVPFVAQRTKSTWPGILSHLVVNGLGIVMALVQILSKP